MAIKKYHVSKNLLFKSIPNANIGTDGKITEYSSGYEFTLYVAEVEEGKTYTTGVSFSQVYALYTSEPVVGSISYDGTRTVIGTGVRNITIPTGSNIRYITVRWGSSVTNAMFNEGETALPYQPYYTPYFEEIGYKKYESATDTITSLPADVIADGQSATANIIGNMVQTGTPSPSSIIMPDECGNKTANLWNEDYTGISGIITYKPLYVGEGTFTMSSDVEISAGSAGTLFLLAGDVSSGASTATNGVYKNHDVTTTAIDGYVTIAYRTYTVDTPVDKHSMLNSGSTALPYEPMGYKIPILSGGTTTPVYLGEVETTRRIKKLVLAGEETWSKSSTYQGSFFANILTGIELSAQLVPSEYMICSHAIVGTLATFAYGRATITGNGATKSINIWLGESEWTVDDFKAYLAQQYSAGTPVTVWYVLATPTTGIVNEPIRKIGSYSDSVSLSNVPTIAGSQTFDVETTLKPSEVQLTYHGWHERSDTKYTE